MIRLIISLYSLLVLAYAIVKLISLPNNKWIELLRSAVEPALNVTRMLMKRFLPFLGMSWAPVVLFVALHVIRWLLGWIV